MQIASPTSRSSSGSSSPPPRPGGAETQERRRAPGRRARGGRAPGHPRGAVGRGRRDHPRARPRLGRRAPARPRRRVRRRDRRRPGAGRARPRRRSRRTRTDDGDEGATSRTTLRLPDSLKARAEAAAAAEGVSLNAWFVRAVSAALEPRRSAPQNARQLLHGVGAMSVFAVDGPPPCGSRSRSGRVEVVATDARRTCRSTSRPATPAARATGRPPRRCAWTASATRSSSRARTGSTVLGPGDSVDVLVEVPEGSTSTVAVKYGSARLVGLVRRRARRGAVRRVRPSTPRTALELKGGHGDFRVTRRRRRRRGGVQVGPCGSARSAGGCASPGADGPITVDRVAGPAELSTSSGSVRARHRGGRAPRCAPPTGRSASATWSAAIVRIDGSYGNVDVGVRRGTAVWLDATSQHGVVPHRPLRRRRPARRRRHARAAASAPATAPSPSTAPTARAAADS